MQIANTAVTDEQFMDALASSDIRLSFKQARPSSLNDAVRHAVELEAFNRAERKHVQDQSFTRSASDYKSCDVSPTHTEFKMHQKTVTDLSF